MVDVTAKEPSHRRAVARCRVYMEPETASKIASGAITKGDVLAVARVAGIQAAKQTPNLLPLCHPLLVGRGARELPPRRHIRRGRGQRRHRRPHRRRDGSAHRGRRSRRSRSTTCASRVDRSMTIGDLQLWEKTGGRSGTWRRQSDGTDPLRAVAPEADNFGAPIAACLRSGLESGRATRKTALSTRSTTLTQPLLASSTNKGGREVLTLVVLVILAALVGGRVASAVAAVPHRARTNDSIGDFNYRLDVLGRTNGGAPAPIGARPVRAGTATRSAKRRRDVDARARSSRSGSPGCSHWQRTSPMLWALNVVADLALLAFFGLWAWARSVEHDRAARFAACRRRGRAIRPSWRCAAPHRRSIRSWTAPTEIAALG